MSVCSDTRLPPPRAPPRSVSDLERSGLVSQAEKGRLKDLIISGDEALRSALEK